MIIVLGMIIGDSLLLVSGFHSLAKDCRWDITVTSTDSPLQEESVVENINTHFDITERVSDYMYDVKNIILKPTAEGKQALELALSISQPKVIMTYWGELMFGRNEGVVQFEMFGALADISAISGVDCGTVICHPTWLVPLPVDKKTLIIDIKVTADGIRQTIQSETIVPMDGFKFEAATRSVSNVLGLQKPLQALDSFSWTNILQLKFLPKASPVIVVGGFQNDHILYAEKEFNEISVLQLTILASLSGPDVCSAGASIVYNTASLQDRILLSTQQGLVEIFGNYRHLQEALVSAHVPQVVLSRCVAGIVLPTQFLLREKHLLIRTVDSVFASRLTEGNNSTSGVFSTLTNISRDVSLLHPAEINTFHSEVIAGSLYLKGLTFPAFITSHVYIWGSKLLHSDDAGASVHMVAEYNSNSNISYFTTSVDGQFAFLTDNGELWYGLVAKTQIKKLNPSGGWYIYHWFNQDLSHGNSLIYSTVSIFFDYHNRLNQVFEFGTPRLSYYMKKYKIDGLLTYQAIAHDLINMDLNDKKIYLDEYTDRVSKWRGRITYQGYNDYLYDNHLLKHEIEINLMDYWKVLNLLMTFKYRSVFHVVIFYVLTVYDTFTI
ncbi:cation channel sperm-associated auxiliary subunit gamma 2-like [Tubulanus polymorphus]|uniref:cation channel sperm-associated auxiliary subunit gamma 2-like n=1 Tax=Tubulanus polymorphus TaxID=672921 RepID=UPI003DA51FEB